MENTNQENEVYYNPETDDKIPMGTKIAIAIGVVLIISIIALC